MDSAEGLSQPAGPPFFHLTSICVFVPRAAVGLKAMCPRCPARAVLTRPGPSDPMPPGQVIWSLCSRGQRTRPPLALSTQEDAALPGTPVEVTLRLLPLPCSLPEPSTRSLTQAMEVQRSQGESGS